MKCPYCSSVNDDDALRCSACSRAIGALGGEETFAADPRRGDGTLPLIHTRDEAIGVATPAPTPAPSAGDAGAETAFVPGLSLELGSAFGPRYRIESILGRGGMGVVYKAHDRELDRTIALKLVRPDLTLDPDCMKRFKQELLLASRVSHKNILRIHDLGDVDGVKFITMAYVEGEDLHHLLKRQGRCPAEQILSVGSQLAAALDAAHAEGVIHRDLKPQNVLIDREGQAYVMDFGLAKSLESDATMTRVGAVLGTPRYMSPEQVEGRPADVRSDLYALGLILYEMATGDIPFSSDSISQMMVQRITRKPQDPKLANPSLPKFLSGVILRCLETDPAKRYQSASEIVEDLGSAHFSKPARSRSSVQITLAVPQTRQSRVLAGIAAVIVLAIVAALAVYKLTRPHPAKVSPTAVAGVPPLSAGKFVAVLPFRVLGDQATLGYLAQGLSEALNAKLFPLDGVHVAAPGAVEQAMKKGSPAEAAKDLGVNLAIQGTLQGGKDRIAVFVDLDDVATGRLLWAGEFTGVPADLLTLEDEISGKLIDHLQLHPGSQELAREAQHPTENVAAYDLYLKGREAVRGMPDAAMVQKAIAFYKDALKHDPSFALSYAGLADASLRMYNETKDRIWVDEATEAAGQARQLNSALPEVYVALGNVYRATGKYAEAIEVLRKAVTLAPNSDESYRQLGEAYQANGQTDKAIDAFKKALAIDPYYWVNADKLGYAYDVAGDYAKALAEFQRVTSLEPDNAAGHENVGNVYMQVGDFGRAVPALERALQLSPTFTQHYSNLGIAYFYVKRFADAAKTLEKAVALSPNQEVVVGNLAQAYLFAGNTQKAKETFSRAIDLAYKQLQVNPRDSDTLADLSLYYANQSESSQALEFIHNARSLAPSNPSYAYDEAVVQALAGKPEKALASLREAFEKGIPALQASYDPQLGSLQTRADFKQLVSQFTPKAEISGQ